MPSKRKQEPDANQQQKDTESQFKSTAGQAVRKIGAKGSAQHAGGDKQYGAEKRYVTDGERKLQSGYFRIFGSSPQPA